MDDRDSVVRALRLLADRARRLAERHPWGSVPPGRRGEIELTLRLPIGSDSEALAAEADRVAAELEAGVRDALLHASAFEPGRVLCLRCRSTSCDDAAPRSPRDVFAGYGATGVPRFVDFAQLLLDCQDPRVATLYADDADELVSLIQLESDLSSELLPAFRDRERGYRIHGQVSVGWYRVPDPSGRAWPLALTFQIVSSSPGGRGPRRFGLNLLGQGPQGETLEHLHDRLRAIPWIGASRWAQAVLDKVEAAERSPAGEALRERRLEGLLNGLARRLERGERARGRRTAHAEERHETGSRPTRMAALDLDRARPEAWLYDTRRHTIVVLGDRGRAHVFNTSGKLVTSVRYPQQTIEGRRRSGLWRAASPDEIAALKAGLGRS